MNNTEEQAKTDASPTFFFSLCSLFVVIGEVNVCATPLCTADGTYMTECTSGFFFNPFTE